MKKITSIMLAMAFSLAGNFAYADCDGALEQLGEYSDDMAHACGKNGAGHNRGPDAAGCQVATKKFNGQQGAVNGQCNQQ